MSFWYPGSEVPKSVQAKIAVEREKPGPAVGFSTATLIQGKFLGNFREI